MLKKLAVSQRLVNLSTSTSFWRSFFWLTVSVPFFFLVVIVRPSLLGPAFFLRVCWKQSWPMQVIQWFSLWLRKMHIWLTWCQPSLCTFPKVIWYKQHIEIAYLKPYHYIYNTLYPSCREKGIIPQLCSTGWSWPVVTISWKLTKDFWHTFFKVYRRKALFPSTIIIKEIQLSKCKNI